jgi:hypothetical protein
MSAIEYIKSFKETYDMIGFLPQRERTDAAIAIMQEIGKDERQGKINTEPATKKQVKMLKDLGIVNTDNLTKKQASDKISEIMKART